MLARDEFLEWARVFGNYYGTHRSDLDEARAAGQGPGTRHRCARCETIKRRRSRRPSRYLSWPLRAQVLEQRLRARSEDREEVIARRLKEAAEEIRKYEDYDYVLINRDLAKPKATLSAIVRAERARRTRIEDQIRPILETFQV